MASSYNTHLIKVRSSYSIKDMELLLGVGRKTCSRWITDHGLKVIDPSARHILVMGSDLKTFLLEKRMTGKFPLKEDEFFCLKCHKAVKAKVGSEGVAKTGKTIGKNHEDQLSKIGTCDFCGTQVNRFLSLYQKD